MLVERQVGDQGFQLAILFAQLLKLAQLVQGKPSVFPLPAVKRLLGHAHFPANIAGLLPRLDLPQGHDDLLFGMPFPRHSSSPRFRSEDHSRRRSQLFRSLIFGFWVKRLQRAAVGVGYLGEVKISEVDTPALLIDLDIMERNLQRAADYAAAHYLRLRPHTKTHKVPALARKQLDLG